MERLSLVNLIIHRYSSWVVVRVPNFTSHHDWIIERELHTAQQKKDENYLNEMYLGFMAHSLSSSSFTSFKSPSFHQKKNSLEFFPFFSFTNHLKSLSVGGDKIKEFKREIYIRDTSYGLKSQFHLSLDQISIWHLTEFSFSRITVNHYHASRSQKWKKVQIFYFFSSLFHIL